MSALGFNESEWYKPETKHSATWWNVEDKANDNDNERQQTREKLLRTSLARGEQGSSLRFGKIRSFFRSILELFSFAELHCSIAIVYRWCVGEQSGQNVFEAPGHLTAVLLEAIDAERLNGSTETEHLRVDPCWTLSYSPSSVLVAYSIRHLFYNTLKNQNKTFWYHTQAGGSAGDLVLPVK